MVVERTYGTEEIARHIARENWDEKHWAKYHPIVRETVDWLAEHGFLVIVSEGARKNYSGAADDGPAATP